MSSYDRSLTKRSARRQCWPSVILRQNGSVASLTVKLARGLIEISTCGKLSTISTQTKYRNLPSVAKAALSRVTTAQPADPENPDINSLRA
jgi:hypothetical protein